MDNLQKLVQSYLESAGYKLIDLREGFIVVDRLLLGGDRDTRLLWIIPPPIEIEDFHQLELRLLREFEANITQYPEARCFLLVHTQEGISRDFRSEAYGRFRIKIRTPIQFFDAPYRSESQQETTEERKAASGVKSAIDPLQKSGLSIRRVPQPYSQLINNDYKKQGDDLLTELLSDFKRYEENSCIRIVVGPAGAGKTILFNALFSSLYQNFHYNKNKNIITPRPVPLIPEYLRQASAVRMRALIENFIRTEVAAPVTPLTFEWMLLNGFSTWLFDGLDELYAEDPGFFVDLTENLTAPGSKAQILICARNSLLTTSENFAQFLQDYPPGTTEKDLIKIYKLNDWEYDSKRTYAWICLEGRVPNKEESDTVRVSQFLTATNRSEVLKSLSGLPYYCHLLIEEFMRGTLEEFPDDFKLIEHNISGIINREVEEKKLLKLEHFVPDGIKDWLETIAAELYEENFRGINISDLVEYARLVLREELPPDELSNTLATLIKLPLFAPGRKEGIVTFEHELIGEYLAGKFFLKRLLKDPALVAQSLGTRIDLADSLILRFIASRLAEHQNDLQTIIMALKEAPRTRRTFAVLLQMILLSTPARDVIIANEIECGSRDLKHVQFRNKNLQNVSFRNCDLSNTAFRACNLQNALFEGAILSGTRFESLSKEALKDARFGNLERFEFIYVGKQRIDQHPKMAEWTRKATGITDKIQKPCPAALQLRTLFLKYVYPDGRWRRDEVPEDVLFRGKQYPEAPSLEDCLNGCIRSDYLQGPDFRKRIKRASGDRIYHMVQFVRAWELTVEMRQLLNSLCKRSGCQHIPRLI